MGNTIRRLIVQRLKGADRALSPKQIEWVFGRVVRKIELGTDLERRAVREIISMMESAVRISNWMRNNRDSHTRREPPLIDTNASRRRRGYSYFGIVVVEDRDTGEEERIPVTIRSSTRLTYHEWMMQAFDAVDVKKVGKKYRNKLEGMSQVTMVDAILLSVNGISVVE